MKKQEKIDNSIILYAFPGSGKTYLAEKYPDQVIDLESSDFQWIDIGEEELRGTDRIKNPEWPYNYHKAIDDALGKYKFILAAHEGTVYAERQGYRYWFVYPSLNRKEEYLQRLIDRGNPSSFVNLIKNNYEKWIEGMMKNKNVEKTFEIYTGYLTDAISDYLEDK